ncbi:MAG: cytochrome c biogenesis protein CcsA [Pseudomonadales bacterium]|nr:cytochrome c biogenesis protein CcsA [Pseudomonadales bacterium]
MQPQPALTIGLAAMAALAYLTASLRVYRRLASAALTNTAATAANQAGASNTPIAVGALAVALHSAVILLIAHNHGGLSSSFFDALSLTALIIVVATMISQFSQHVMTLLLPVYLFAASGVLAAPLLGHHTAIEAHSSGMLLHIVSSIAGYSVVFVAALHALQLYAAEKKLRAGITRPWLQALPPLQTMENHLFHLIALGWLVISVAITSGALYVENLLDQQLLHKTVFSIVSWLLLSALLAGRWLYGWRGRTAVRWTLGAFIALLLGYLGSKFMLDIVLGTL